MAVASAGLYASLHLLQTDNHANTSPLSFLQAGCPSYRPTNSVKALKAYRNSETWTVKSEDKQKLRVLEMSALYLLKKISGIRRRDRRRSIDILKELGVEKDIAEVLEARRLVYFGNT